ncbi:MAG: SLC13 family permease [Candidatus Lokiarchaeota archaeon]|jgi:Na+/H+ antiporter NhaD/arsenite permease-like protein
MNTPAIILVLVLFAILMAFFSQDRFDYFPIVLIIGTIAVVSMISIYGLEQQKILTFINFNTLIFIFGMQIIIYYATSDRILEYVAIKLIHVTKGNNRMFFYMICILTATLVAFIEDLTLSLILMPLIFRTCKILKIPAGTYMMGMTISINIGAILTPISSLKNLIIGQEFGWGFGEYFANMGILYLITLVLTLLLLDRLILKKEETPTEENKKILLSFLDPGIVIENKRHFLTTSIIILGTFGFMLLGFTPALVAIISAAILLFIHRNSLNFDELKSEISWKIIILFAVLFILSNSLTEFGFSEFLSSFLENIIQGNIFLAVLITLGISSLLSAFLAGTPVTIILLPIFSAIASQSLFPNPIIIAFISGVNLAGNFLPQGSACDMLTLNLAKKYKVINLNYRRLLKNGSLFAALHFVIVLGYTMLYTLILT